MKNKKKIFSGVFYPLQKGEILYGKDHYNNKIGLLNDFDLKAFCYNSDGNKFDILRREENNKSYQVLRFNEKTNDEYAIENLFKFWKPDIINFHGGVGKTSGQKGTSYEVIEKYKGQGIKFCGEYGGGYNLETMRSNYYNEDADAIIMNHNKWADFFPEEYRKRIYITPKQQSVDSEFFIPMDIDKKYDILFIGRNQNKGQTSLYNMFKNEKDIKLLLKGNGYPESWKQENIFIEPAEYNHEKIREVYNSAKILAMGRPEIIMENPYALHMRIITEAISVGLPVVGFKQNFVGSNLLYNNHNAFLVESEIEFIEKVRLLLSDKKLYEEMSYNSRQIGIECNISKFMQFYRELWNSL